MDPRMTRRTFAGLGAAALAAAESARRCPVAAGEPASVPADEASVLVARPYQLMCIVCRIGEGGEGPADERLRRILHAVRQDRKRPLSLRCNVDTVFRYQNPGHADDTPEGELFNAKRDLDILQKLGMAPGDTRPAVDVFERLLAKVPTAGGICAYDAVTGDAWRGCSRASSGFYEKGRALGIQAIFTPRDAKEKATAKAESAAAMYQAKALRIRPHHLMCMSCFFGRAEKLAPLVEDNLFEAVEAIQKTPDIPVTLVAGCCMICPPCSLYDPQSNLCVGGRSMALRDQKKDLDVLQKLGLKYGDTMPARRLFELLYARIPSTRDVCAYGDGEARSPEWSICGGAERDEAYQRARAQRLGIPG